MSDIIYQTVQILNDFKLNFDFCLEYQMYGDETSSHSFFSLESTKQMIVILVSIH